MFYKKRAWRRHKTRRIQKKRLKNLMETQGERELSKSHLGMLKKNHLGCGCSMCKPWKWGFDKKFTISERKKLQKEK